MAHPTQTVPLQPIDRPSGTVPEVVVHIFEPRSAAPLAVLRTPAPEILRSLMLAERRKRPRRLRVPAGTAGARD